MTEIVLSNESRFIKFSLLVLFGIVSIICAVYIIYNVIKISSVRKRFQNQTLIILIFLVLLNTIFNIPTTFSFFARGYALSETELFCNIWQILDSIFTACIIWCKALFTVERYVLVFYPYYLRSQRQKLIFHYIPIILIGLYLNLFYIFVNVLLPCDRKLKFNQHLCGDQCVDHTSGLSTFNRLFNILFPVFIGILGSLILLIRISRKRREMQRNLRRWSRNRKMIVQLLGIAITYTIVWLPVSIVSLITMLHSSVESAESIANHFYYVTYLCELTVPVVSLFFWPEIMQKLHRRLRSSAVVFVTTGQYPTY